MVTWLFSSLNPWRILTGSLNKVVGVVFNLDKALFSDREYRSSGLFPRSI
jgi:hypothetical protein